jgi:prepilin-type N-terminal cleavage/methylation domain-containing protein
MARGFTLLEVAIAIALLGVVLATAMELLGVGLRSARASSDYTGAVILARQKLAEVTLDRLQPGTTEGRTDGGYRWKTEATLDEEKEQPQTARLMTVRVTVAWTGRSGDRRMELVTLRPWVGEGASGLVAPGPQRGRLAPRSLPVGPRRPGEAP